MSALALVVALIGGKIALSALSAGEIITLAQAGISVARLAIVLNQQLDRQFPCDRKCQRIAQEANLRAMEDGWRYPYVGGRHNP